MTKENVLYLVHRPVIVKQDQYEKVRLEFLELFKPLRAAVKAKMDAEEEYVIDDAYVRRLKPDCEPIRELRYSIPLEENGAVVGFVLLRATNVPHKTRIDMYNDCLERTYELRFKTFAGVLAGIESSGIAISQTNDGSLRFNTGSISFFHQDILEKNFEKFKAVIPTVIDNLKEHTIYGKANQYWQH